MLKITRIILILVFASSAFAQVESKCFQNDGLKDSHILQFAANGGDVVGSYFIERDYDSATTETYDFSGSRAGNSLTVEFPKYEKLSRPPFEVKKAVLTLIRSGDREILRAKFYSAGKPAAYSMLLESCEPSYTALLKIARRVSSAKSAKSATFKVELQSRTERKAFLLNVKKSQIVSVVAPGCGIAFYYPDKTAYEEGAAIDNFEMKSPQSGDYLFVIKPAGKPGKCAVIFKTIN